MSFKSFEELEVWKKARDLRKQISSVTKTFPKEETYRLADQLLRSSRSISANIAEGFGRFHHQENIQFCRIAGGSLYETLEHIICAVDENYITKDLYQNLRKQFDVVLKLLNGYIAYLKKTKSTQQPNNPTT